MSSPTTPKPVRGEVWLATLDPVRANEQGGTRPVIIVSANLLNRGRSGLVVIVPTTTRERRLPWHIAIDPPEGAAPTQFREMRGHAISHHRTTA